MEQSPELSHAVVYTAGHAFCLEPQTCAIDAFNLHERGVEGTGTVVVAPGRPLVATSVWRWACGGARQP
jgi:galactose mutarotase-like enzyme